MFVTNKQGSREDKASKIVYLYLRLSFLLQWLPAKLKAGHQAIWLGMLDAKALNEVTNASYMPSSGFGSQEHNLMGFYPWEDDVIRRFFSRCQTVLVAGAGGGREVIALAKRGIKVTAFDCSKYLTNACRNNLKESHLSALVLISLPDAVAESLDSYEGLVVGRGVYHHIPGRKKRIHFLQQCRKHLKPGAPVFLSDFFTRPQRSPGLQCIRSIAQFVRWIRRSHESVELGDSLTTAFQHLFIPHEIESELAEAGFKLEHYHTTPYGPETRLAHAVGILSLSDVDSIVKLKR